MVLNTKNNNLLKKFKSNAFILIYYENRYKSLYGNVKVAKETNILTSVFVHTKFLCI